MGWVDALPFLARRTCRAAPSKSICDHSRSQTSEARSPCRYVTSSIVASRCPLRLVFAASISFSTSLGVRCSRVRYSLFANRVGATARFSASGFTNLRRGFIREGSTVCVKLLVHQLQVEQFTSDSLVGHRQ